MSKKSKSKRKQTRKYKPKVSQLGLSFVELSMVVVIAALLVGSFLTFKNFQHASKLRSVITEVSKLKAGISEFRDKYFALPGDMTLATSYWSGTCNSSVTGSCDGDGDGSIVWDNIEGVKAWHHMYLAGIFAVAYDGNCTSGNCLGVLNVNIPESAFPHAGYYLDNTATTNLKNAIGLAAAGKFGTSGSEILTPVDAESLDVKLDDSLPGEGIAQAYPMTNPCVDTSGTPNKYDITQTAVSCQMFFRLSNFN